MYLKGPLPFFRFLRFRTQGVLGLANGPASCGLRAAGGHQPWAAGRGQGRQEALAAGCGTNKK